MLISLLLALLVAAGGALHVIRPVQTHDVLGGPVGGPVQTHDVLGGPVGSPHP